MKVEKNQKGIWDARNILGDYFSRLGGSARPYNMSESEIFLYILWKLHQKTKIYKTIGISVKNELYIDSGFLEAAQPVINKVDELIENIQIEDVELIKFIDEFYDYHDEKLKNDKTSRWIKFGKFIKGND